MAGHRGPSDQSRRRRRRERVRQSRDRYPVVGRRTAGNRAVSRGRSRRTVGRPRQSYRRRQEDVCERERAEAGVAPSAMRSGVRHAARADHDILARAAVETATTSRKQAGAWRGLAAAGGTRLGCHACIVGLAVNPALGSPPPSASVPTLSLRSFSELSWCAVPAPEIPVMTGRVRDCTLSIAPWPISRRHELARAGRDCPVE